MIEHTQERERQLQRIVESFKRGDLIKVISNDDENPGTTQYNAFAEGPVYFDPSADVPIPAPKVTLES